MSTAENPALVLNADFRPLSYYPLSLCSWQDAIKAVFLERVSVIENYDLEEGVVVKEIQAGYMMYDRLLRPAMVGVSKKTKQKSKSAKDQDLKSDKKNIEKDSKN